MGKFATVILSLMLIWLPALTLADQTDKRLDDLFARLQKPDGKIPPSAIEAQIWHIWLQSKSPTTNLLMQRGIDAMSNGQHAVALEIFTEMTELEPDFAEGWNKRATVLYLMGKMEESITDCDKVLKLEPRHFGALSGLGLIYTALEQPKRALDAFERVLLVYPGNRHATVQVKALRRKIKGEKI